MHLIGRQAQFTGNGESRVHARLSGAQSAKNGGDADQSSRKADQYCKSHASQGTLRSDPPRWMVRWVLPIGVCKELWQKPSMIAIKAETSFLLTLLYETSMFLLVLSKRIASTLSFTNYAWLCRINGSLVVKTQNLAVGNATANVLDSIR